MTAARSDLMALADRLSGHLGPFAFLTEGEKNLVIEALRLAASQPDREALARSIEGIILRRVYEKRIEGYTLEMSLEQADAILSLLSGAGTKSDGGVEGHAISSTGPALEQSRQLETPSAGIKPGPSDPSPGPDVSLSVPVGEPRATKKVYIKPLRTIVEIQNVYADKIRDLLNTRPPAPAVGPDVREALEVAQQALMEVSAAQDLGPSWFTKGESALRSHVRMWVKKGLDACNAALTRPLGGFVQGSIATKQSTDPEGSSRTKTAGWKHIGEIPSKPMMVEFFCRDLMFRDYKTGETTSPIIAPWRDCRFDLGYFDGSDFRDLGTGHLTFENYSAHPASDFPTHYRELVPPAVAETHSRESSESPPPAVFSDPTPT